jgi:hypothetical protein
MVMYFLAGILGSLLGQAQVVAKGVIRCLKRLCLKPPTEALLAVLHGLSVVVLEAYQHA